MIAFAKLPAPECCDFSSAQCTIAPVPAPCLDCSPEPNPADFTITFSGLPDGFTCDVLEAERVKRELLELMRRRGL